MRTSRIELLSLGWKPRALPIYQVRVVRAAGLEPASLEFGTPGPSP